MFAVVESGSGRNVERKGERENGNELGTRLSELELEGEGRVRERETNPRESVPRSRA